MPEIEGVERSRESSVVTRRGCEKCCERGYVRGLKEAAELIDELIDRVREADVLDPDTWSLVLLPPLAPVVTPAGPIVTTKIGFQWIRFTPGTIALYIVPAGLILLVTLWSKILREELLGVMREGVNGILTLAVEQLKPVPPGTTVRAGTDPCAECCKKEALPQGTGKRTWISAKGIKLFTRAAPDGAITLPALPALPPSQEPGG